MLQAIYDLLRNADWSVEDFKRALAGDDNRGTVFVKREKPEWYEEIGGADPSNSAFQYYSGDCTLIGCTNENVVSFYNGAFSSGDQWLKVVTVHELGHAWDSASDDRISGEFMDYVGAGYKQKCGPGYCDEYYDPGKAIPLTDHGAKNHYEDFAESVAAAVYPNYHLFRGQLEKSGKRINYVNRQFAKFRNK
jgi:hypothetical protein